METTINVDEELVYQVRIQALKEGYELDAMTEMLYENYLYGGIEHDEKELIRIQKSWDAYTRKYVKKEVRRLEAELKIVQEKKAKSNAILTQNKELISDADIEKIFRPIS